MAEPRNDGLLDGSKRPERENGITLANARWAALGGPPAPRRPREPGEGRLRRLAQRTPEQASPPASPWKEADRALAEINAATRGGLVSTGKDRDMLERTTAAVRDSLLEAAQAASEASRRAQALAEMLDESLAALGTSQGERPHATSARKARPVPGEDALSKREREVLTRVAAGRTNKAIAEDLFVSPNTVKTHVASLLRKLNVNTRAQLATIAVQQGMS